MKLSVVIVNWNVRELVRKCLDSLFLYASDIEHEIIVVDNASGDGSADMIAATYPFARLIRNEENRGFAAACNQGAAAAKGEYVLFLNPDTRIQEGALHKLLAFAAERPQAGCVAPQLLNDDGSVQPSVRKFPGPLFSLLLFFRLVRWHDEAYAEARTIEQPQGACMLVPRTVLTRVGAFDERFFLWFDEVDLCKRIRDTGYEIWYVPEARIFHHRGESFRQKPTSEKQKIFYRSFSQYLWKHWRLRAALPAALMGWYSRILARPWFWVTLGAVGVVEVLSLVGYFFPIVGQAAFVAVVGASLALGMRSFFYPAAFLAVELVIGSKGHLLSLPIGDFDLSLRMGLFAALFACWFVHLVRSKSMPALVRSPLVGAYVLLAIAVAWGVVRGLSSGQSAALIYADANGWLFFLTAFPLYDALVSREDFRRFFSVAAGALAAQITKAAAILYMMSHRSFGHEILYPFYRWIRDTGIGEVTQFDWGVRVFFQSNLYPVLFLFIAVPAIAYVLRTGTIGALFRRHARHLFLFAGATGLFLMSFSRSFWLAAAAGGVGILIWYVFARQIKTIVRMVTVYLSALAIALAAIATISYFPLPATTGGIGLDAFTKRLEDTQTEAAAASRWSLLPVLRDTIAEQPVLGHGFGKTVTYTSFDPRVREGNASGSFTTYAFEWGYLDFLVKTGFVGLAAYLFFAYALVRSGYRSARTANDPVAQGILIGIGVLAAIHMFTPYLNHPLGIAYLIFAGVYFERLSNQQLVQIPASE